MLKADAVRLTRDVLDRYDLDDVTVVLNPRLTRAFGRYKWNALTGLKRIELSTKLVEANDEARVLRVIYHEVAHALTQGHGHDSVWKAKCLEIGGDGEAQYSRADTNTIERARSSKLYVLECQKCGYGGGRRYRRKMTGYRHRGCGGELNNVELT